MACWRNGRRASEDAPLPRPSSEAPPIQRFWMQVQASPYRFDLFQMLRWLDAVHDGAAPLGKARHPRQEPVRMRQAPSLAFAPATIAEVSPPQGMRPAAVSIYSFGLFGPNGPLPLHMTEYVHERVKHHRDHSFAAFADLFHQRLILLFYRAWADAQPVVDMDRRQDRFTRYVSSLVHLGDPGLRRTNGVPEHAALFMAPHLARQMRSQESLEQILASFFGVGVALQPYTPQWMPLSEDECVRLGQRGQLGASSVLGLNVYDVQHKFRLRLGPLTREQYLAFMPGARLARALVDWVRLYTGLEYAWDVQLVLAADQVGGVRLQAGAGLGQGALGRASWLGRRDPGLGDAADFVKDYSLLEGENG